MGPSVLVSLYPCIRHLWKTYGPMALWLARQENLAPPVPLHPVEPVEDNLGPPHHFWKET